ncbi:MAG: protein-methionine-sulfoxide reductase catalytic subunit MsrP [Planctomycetaceae bacterium]|nr:protein-methionine-sulfoxide reductase catalytic subunit MsrP [Planctomycetaceae bacterium]
MNYLRRQIWDIPESKHTSESVYRERKTHRREFLERMGIASAGLLLPWALSGCNEEAPPTVQPANVVDPPVPVADPENESPTTSSHYPAKRNPKFEYGRDETDREEAAKYCNFYEFTTSKSAYKYVDKFQPTPWEFEVDGLCGKPRKFDLDDVYKTFTLQERAYRHRCVETWAMCVPWTGFPLSELLKLVEPKPEAKFVAFETFNRPKEAPRMNEPTEPWPYTEGLTIEEAMNDLTLVTTGIYGQPLLKQHGAPIRIVTPWKYGFKSIKSIVKVTLTDKQPATFWNTLIPHEYGFRANVNPEVPHPRWSQRRERMLGTGEAFDTVVYNGYGDFVGKLYKS